MNRSLLRSLQRTLAAQQRFASLGGGGTATGGYIGGVQAERGYTDTAPNRQALRDELQQQVERERDSLAAELLKIRAEAPGDKTLSGLASEANAAAAVIYPDLPAEEEPANAEA